SRHAIGAGIGQPLCPRRENDEPASCQPPRPPAVQPSGRSAVQASSRLDTRYIADISCARRHIAAISRKGAQMWVGYGDCRGAAQENCHPRRARWGGPGGWGFENFGDLWGAAARGGPRRPRQAGRMFEQGDLKLVILRLLE